jgi:hypothetical protein
MRRRMIILQRKTQRDSVICSRLQVATSEERENSNSLQDLNLHLYPRLLLNTLDRNSYKSYFYLLVFLDL